MNSYYNNQNNSIYDTKNTNLYNFNNIDTSDIHDLTFIYNLSKENSPTNSSINSYNSLSKISYIGNRDSISSINSYNTVITNSYNNDKISTSSKISLSNESLISDIDDLENNSVKDDNDILENSNILKDENTIDDNSSIPMLELDRLSISTSSSCIMYTNNKPDNKPFNLHYKIYQKRFNSLILNTYHLSFFDKLKLKYIS